MSMREKMLEANRRVWDEWPVAIHAGNVEEVRSAAMDAVLDALMEPTEGMQEMGDHAYNLTGICGALSPNTSQEHTNFIWQAMIQAARDGK